MEKKNFHMDLSANLAVAISKSSNFTIDHILNNAGNKSVSRSTVKSEPNSDVPNEKYSNNSYVMHSHSQSKEFAPILNWLQYSRYKPPKIPRPMKVGPVKRTPGRLPRIPFTPHQLNELEAAYKQANYLSSEDANKLAMRLSLTCTRIKIWFQNRRARERRENREVHLTPSTSLPLQKCIEQNVDS